MIQIYKRENTNFDMNGDAVLEPSVCEIDTSTWELNLEHPKDSTGKWKLIQGGAVLKVPSFLSDDQLFRICEPSKSDFGVTAIAYPIFFDSRDELMLDDVRPTNKNGQQALDIMCAGSKYNGESNIKDISTAYYNYKNLMEALTSEEDNSFINRWGGEVLYDNYKVIINEHIGSDNGVELLYGKNIPENGMNITENQRNIVTRIYPKAYNGYMISGNKPYVDSSIANCYTPSIRQRVIEFQDVKMKEDASENDEENGIIICANQTELDAALKKKCIELFEQGIDKPEITIECDMVMLQNSVDYAKYKDLEKVSKGDTVHCKNENLDIEITARVMSLIYDCILDNVKSVVIGSELYNYFKDTSSVINSVNKVVDTSNDTLMANRITGVINLLNTSLRAQKDIAQRQDVRAILFEDLDTKSPTFGALCIGTQGIQIAKKRTPDDSNWQWGTAIDFQSINADYVITGILTDKNGKFYLNLDTGEFRMKDGTFVGIINGATINGGTINGSEIKTDKDLHVGNSIRLGYGKEQSERRILSDDHVHIQFGKGDFSSLSLNVGNNQLRVSNTAILMYLANKMKLNISSDLFSINDKNGNAAHTFRDNGCTIGGSLLTVEGQLSVKQLALFRGDLSVLGKKNRIVKTENFGHIKLNAVESTYAVFEDYGTGQLDSNGYCEIVLEDKFLETVNAEEEYYAFLTPLSEGKLFVKEKNTASFIAEGTPYTKFDWRVTIKQRGYENVRMEECKEVQHDNNN